MEHKMRLLDWGLLILLSLIWGGSFYYVEVALREVTPLVVVWARVGIAGLGLLLLLPVLKIPLVRDLRVWRAFFVMGVLNNVVPYSLIAWGQTEISGSLASIFNATTPLFTIVLAQFLTADEKINGLKVTGLILGFCGVVLMVGLEALDGLSGAVLAQCAILGAAISYGCAAIWGRRFKTVHPMMSTCGQVVCSSIVMTPFAVIYGFPNGYILPSVEVMTALVLLALACTALAYILYFKILSTSGATNLMLVTFLIPLSAISLGFFFLGERLSLDQVAGMGLILFGLLVIDGRIVAYRFSFSR